MKPEPFTGLDAMWAGMERRRHWIIGRMVAATVIVIGLLSFPTILTNGWLSLPRWVWMCFGAALTGHLLATGMTLADAVQRETQSRLIWQYSQELNRIELEQFEHWAGFDDRPEEEQA